MARKREKGEVKKYFAENHNGEPFLHCYGKNEGQVFLSDSIERVANNIAYYFHRCYPTLMIVKNGKTKKASKREQEKFEKMLSSEFFFYENR